MELLVEDNLDYSVTELIWKRKENHSQALGGLLVQ